jgi:PAS domain-containing protein
MTLEAENARLQQRVHELEQQLAQWRDRPPAGPPPKPYGINLDRKREPTEVDPFNSEGLFRAYVETANDMVYAVDLLGRLVFINPY